MKGFATGRLSYRKNHLKRFWLKSELISYVPPLRGLVVRVITVPPLPRWAAVFRPWRDWLERR
jgi:hypothetical protein